MRQVMVLDPSGYVDVEAVGLAPRVRDLAGKTAGLLDDGLPLADVLLDRIGELLREQHGVAKVVRRQKPNLSSPAPASLLDGLKAEVDFVVVGVGG